MPQLISESTKIGSTWTDAMPPDAESAYDHCSCNTPLGKALIEWKSWKSCPGYSLTIGNDDLGCFVDLAEAKAAAVAHIQAIADQCAAWGTCPAPPVVELDWRLIAKLAGDHGVRYWTNRAFEQFVTAILSTLSAEGLRALSDRATPGPWSWEQCGEKEDVPVVGIAFPGDDAECKAPYEGEFRDSDASRMTIAFDWQSCDGHSPSANAAFAVAAVNFVRTLLATPASHAGNGGK